MESAEVDIAEGWQELSQEDQLAALKATVTVPEVAMLLGLEPNSLGKITSPWNPEERTPSCHLWEDHWYDFSTGKGGDIFDLVQAFNPGTNLPEAVKAIRNRALRAGKQYGDVEAVVPRELQAFDVDLAAFLTIDVYMGLDVREYDLRVTPAGDVLVPHRSPESGVYGVKVRQAGGGKASWAGSQFTHRLYDPFGWDHERYLIQPSVIICEGESDSWALYSVITENDRCDVLALPSGASAWKDHWLEDLEPYETVFVCADNDHAGQQARDKLLRKIGYGRAEVLRVPQLYNDAREAVAAGWRPFG